MEIPIDIDGKVVNILINTGDLISPGQKILEIETSTTIPEKAIENEKNEEDIVVVKEKKEKEQKQEIQNKPSKIEKNISFPLWG